MGQFYDKLRKNISKQRMDRMDELLKGEERLLDIALLISVSAEVKHDVDMMVEKIQALHKDTWQISTIWTINSWQHSAPLFPWE